MEETYKRKRKPDDEPSDSQATNRNSNDNNNDCNSNSRSKMNYGFHFGILQYQPPVPMLAPGGPQQPPSHNCLTTSTPGQFKQSSVVLRQYLAFCNHENSAKHHTPPYSRNATEVMAGGNEALAYDRLQQFCQSPEMIVFAALEGFGRPRFTVNAHTKPGNPVYDRFFAAVRQLVKIPDQTTAQIEIVFHGTKQANIQGILQNGLDHSRRKGQAYGIGEYFSRRPHTSLSYCNRGTEMLVFCVVVPDACRIVPPEKDCKVTQAEDDDDEIARGFRRKIPPSYVVVPTVEHQLPLGVLSWESATAGTLEKSITMRNTLWALTQHVKQKEQAAEEASLKAGIIQLLIQKYIDTASNRYEKARDKLSPLSLKEISMFAHQLFDMEVVAFYFPGLPAPMSKTEHDETKIHSVEETERDLSQAQKKLEDAQKAMATEIAFS